MRGAMVRGLLVGGMLTAIGGMSLASPAGAQGTPVFLDRCTGVDHSGTRSASPSAILVGFTVADVAPGTPLDVALEGPGGATAGSGQTDDAGRVVAVVPIFEYGTYQATELAVGGQAADPAEVGDGGTIVVGPEERACGVEQLDAAPPPTTTTAAPTTTTATTASAGTASVTTIGASEVATTEPAAAPTTTSTAAPSSGSEGSGDLGWWLLLAVGLVLLLGSTGLLLSPGLTVVGRRRASRDAMTERTDPELGTVTRPRQPRDASRFADTTRVTETDEDADDARDLAEPDCHNLFLQAPESMAVKVNRLAGVDDGMRSLVEGALGRIRQAFADMLGTDEVRRGLDLLPADDRRAFDVALNRSQLPPRRAGGAGPTADAARDEVVSAMSALAGITVTSVGIAINGEPFGQRAGMSCHLTPVHRLDQHRPIRFTVTDRIESCRQEASGRVATLEVHGQPVQVAGEPTAVPKEGFVEFPLPDDGIVRGVATPLRAYGTVRVEARFVCCQLREHARTTTMRWHGPSEQEVRARAQSEFDERGQWIAYIDATVDAVCGLASIVNAAIDTFAAGANAAADAVSVPGVSAVPTIFGVSAEIVENVVQAGTGGLQAIWNLLKIALMAASREALDVNTRFAAQLPQAGVPGAPEIRQ